MENIPVCAGRREMFSLAAASVPPGLASVDERSKIGTERKRWDSAMTAVATYPEVEVEQEQKIEQARQLEKIHVEKPQVRNQPGYLIAKRAFDILVSLAALALLILPMLIITLVIVIDSPGDPFFRQERLGKNGRPFMIYKFRTMRLDAEAAGPQWAKEDDERCTHLGKFLRKVRLDELPQLFNILKGDMSIVGPRPERKYFYDQFEEYIDGFSYRLLVTPGLTGWAQVNGGYDLKPEEKIVYDVEYINRRSIGMDLTCILRTIKIVFTGDGAR